MSERSDQLANEAIAQFLRSRSADPDLSLLDDIVRMVGATPQDRPWLGLSSILLPRRTLLIVASALLLATMGAIGVGSRFLQPDPLLPDLTNTFVSPRNGFSINHPDGVAITPAEELWDFSQADDDGFDVVETGLDADFKGTSAQQPPNPDLCFDSGSEPIPCESTDERLDRLLADGGCGVPRSQQEEIIIDGQSGRVAECPNQIEATVFASGQLYLFTLSHDRSDAREVFDAFVATIDLTPRAAVDSPALTHTFVSPTYGYSFGYNRGITPATERWDPDDPSVEDIDRHLQFDAVETGNLAYFEAASTPIPDGVPIDEWVDAYVTPEAAGGCGVPRSQQAEITIDGQPGRIAECAYTQATVVAGGRLYLFTLYRTGYARAMFDAWVATIDLTPETATVP